MGRYVHNMDTGEIVWKYVVGIQPSEQFRIAWQLGVGRIEESPDGFGDILYIKREEIPKLKEWYNKAMSKLRIHEISYNIFIYANEHIWKSVEHPLAFEPMLRSVFGLEDIYFVKMVGAYIRFMEKHPEIKVFRFYGEY